VSVPGVEGHGVGAASPPSAAAIHDPDTPRRYIGQVILGVLIGLGVGLVAGVVWHLARGSAGAGALRLAEGRLDDAQTAMASLEAQLRAATDAAAAAETSRAVAVSQLELVRRAEDEARARADEERALLAGTFADLSAQALAQNNEQFLALAGTKLSEARTAAQGDLSQREQAFAALLTPLRETLSRYERGLQEMELERKGAYAGLSERVAALHAGHEQLAKETRNLVTALRSPHTRGRWGEMTLRRAVEAAGMIEHCDFDEQATTTTPDGQFRPDMVVHLPGGGEVVVDSKVPLDAFLAFTEADDDAGRKAHLERHARQLRTHVEQLAKKEYWRQFERSPEFVVAFIPGESLLAAACEADPALQDHALSRRIVLATPNTLVASLRTIALSWQQDRMAENAREVRQLGAELYERLRTMTGHLQSLQRSLTSSVESYNKAVGSLESRVLVSARKFPGLGVVAAESSEIVELPPIEVTTRHLQALDLVDDEDAVGEQDAAEDAVGAQPTLLALPDTGAAGTGT
jgi:DNA recombination protein RmuC